MCDRYRTTTAASVKASRKTAATSGLIRAIARSTHLPTRCRLHGAFGSPVRPVHPSADLPPGIHALEEFDLFIPQRLDTVWVVARLCRCVELSLYLRGCGQIGAPRV